MLLFRAFHERYTNINNSEKLCNVIEECLWKLDETGQRLKGKHKLETEVAVDEDKQDFREILETGKAIDNRKDRYAKNYKFFQKNIEAFLNQNPKDFAYLPARILNNVILLVIEEDTQESALRIFSTLNNRGKPLSDSDIFKAQLYEYYIAQNCKEVFIDRWKKMEEIWTKIYKEAPMDKLFTMYMHYVSTRDKVKALSLHKFYEHNHYALLKNDTTFKELIHLTNFWCKTTLCQDNKTFSERILKSFFVLEYMSSELWKNVVSVYYLKNRKNFSNEAFYELLNKLIAFMLGWTLMGHPADSLRTPFNTAMQNIIQDKKVTFTSYKFSERNLTQTFNKYSFTNRQPLTKSMLAWWACRNEQQKVIPINQSLDIEHIYAKTLAHGQRIEVESIGNKSLLEPSINRAVTNFPWDTKIKYYVGEIPVEPLIGTCIKDLRDMASELTSFTQTEITDRKKKICSNFISYVKENGLI